MGSKESFNSFKDFAKDYFSKHPECLTLLKYGIDLPTDELENIEIIDKDWESITYINKKTNEIVKSYIYKKIYDRIDKIDATCLSINNQDENIYIDYFDNIDATKDYSNAIINSRKNPEKRILSRVYKDVDTKYGKFCLHAEEGSDMCSIGAYKQISLYHGSHDEIIDYRNDFDFGKYCIIRFKHYIKENFDQWIMGYISKTGYSNPDINMWQYNTSFSNNQSVDSPIYGFEHRNNSEAGTIIMDGSIKVKDNENSVPSYRIIRFWNGVVEEYENKACNSKAYFANYNGFVSITKHGKFININCTGRNNTSFGWHGTSSIVLLSETDGQFTPDDFKIIISKIESLDVVEKGKLKISIINQLRNYLNIHDKDDFSKVNKYGLTDVTFEDMVLKMKDKDISQIIEKYLEDMCDTFNISMEDLLGNPPQDMKSEYVPTYKNKDK